MHFARILNLRLETCEFYKIVSGLLGKRTFLFRLLVIEAPVCAVYLIGLGRFIFLCEASDNHKR